MTFVGVFVSAILAILTITGAFELTLLTILLPILIGLAVDITIIVVQFFFVLFLGNKFGDF